VFQIADQPPWPAVTPLRNDPGSFPYAERLINGHSRSATRRSRAPRHRSPPAGTAQCAAPATGTDHAGVLLRTAHSVDDPRRPGRRSAPVLDREPVASDPNSGNGTVPAAIHFETAVLLECRLFHDPFVE